MMSNFILVCAYVCVYAHDAVFDTCFSIRVYRYTCVNLIPGFPLISWFLFMFLVIACTCMSESHHLIMYTFACLYTPLGTRLTTRWVVSNNPESACPDFRAWSLLYASEKSQLQNSFNWIEDYKGYNPITKEERMIGSPLCLMLGSSCSGGEWVLFSVDRSNVKFLLWILSLDLLVE